MADPYRDAGGWYDTAGKIAAHCTRTMWGNRSFMSPQERYDAALDGIIEYVADFGWPPGDLKPVYSAAARALQTARRVLPRDVRWWSYWYDPPGMDDALGEAVTDKIAVHQLAAVLTEGERHAVWATAEVMKWGGAAEEAAALLGIHRAALSQLLLSARRKCWAAWVAPGETPRAAIYKRTHAPGTQGRLQTWHDHQAGRQTDPSWIRRHAERGHDDDWRTAVAEAVNGSTAQLADMELLASMTNHNIRATKIRRWWRDGLLEPRGRDPEYGPLFSVDEFVRVAVEQTSLRTEPKESAA